jgi:PAS domain S-box-containing protein
MPRFLGRAGVVGWLGVALCLASLLLVFRAAVAPTSPVAEPLAFVDLSVAVVLGVIGVAILIARRAGRHAPSSPEHSRAGFVMETFQRLLRDLKEKETDLDRLRAEAVSRAERVERYNENILRSIPSGVITCDSQGIITTFNLAAERILGRAAGDVVGNPCDQVFGETSPIAAMVGRSVAERVPISRQQWNFLRGADRRCVGLSSALLRDQADRVIGVTVVFTDLTEIQRLEEQVESERRLSVLGEMSAGIAHEFRNYMGTILGWVKLLAKRLPEGDSGGPMVEAIIRELSAMQRLIDDLLAFGRDLEPQREPLSLRELLKEAASLRPARSDVRVTVTISPEAPSEVNWDHTLVRQALKNLVQNAAEAIPEGGAVTVEATVSSGQSNAIDLAVSDTGVGIPAEFLDRIFLPFFTLKAKGHGLGLALVHKIVLAHGGRIHVTSREGVGTTFTVTMPVFAAASSRRGGRLSEAA